MCSLDARCATRSGSRPSPANEDASSGALLGAASEVDVGPGAGTSILGLWEKREEMI
jgi:hypothetical protein